MTRFAISFGPLYSPVSLSDWHTTVFPLNVVNVAVPLVEVKVLFGPGPESQSNLPFVVTSFVQAAVENLPPVFATHLPYSGGAAAAVDTATTLSAKIAARQYPTSLIRFISSSPSPRVSFPAPELFSSLKSFDAALGDVKPIATNATRSRYLD
jgi:hypothetical protein